MHLKIRIYVAVPKTLQLFDFGKTALLQYNLRTCNKWKSKWTLDCTNAFLKSGVTQTTVHERTNCFEI